MVHVFTSFVLFEGEKFHGGGRVWYFNVIWLKSIHTFTFIVTVFTASASIRVSARNASLYIAVMIFCAQPYLKPCFMCPFYILSTCPSKGLCTALIPTINNMFNRLAPFPTACTFSPPLLIINWGPQMYTRLFTSSVQNSRSTNSFDYLALVRDSSKNGGGLRPPSLSAAKTGKIASGTLTNFLFLFAMWNNWICTFAQAG